MLVEQTIHPRVVENAEVRRSGRSPSLTCEIVEAAHEPVGERKLKADLALVELPLGKPGLDRLPEHVFARVPLDLELGWHGEREVHEAMRQERHARFERVSHAG